MFAILFAIITSFIYPQEKVHVMTDREFYLAGDTVWMHSVLVDDIDTTVVHGRSRYLYAEIRDFRDSLMNRVKLRATLTRVRPHLQSDERNLTIFSGYIVLPSHISSGDYTLVAYTSYMSGTIEQGWFKKRLHVLTPQDVAYGFVPRAVMEPDFLEARCDTVIHLAQGAEDMSLMSLAGLSDEPQIIMASVNNNKYAPAAHTEPYMDDVLANVPDIYSPEFIDAVGGVITPRNPIEVGQVVSGTVYGNWKTHTPQSDVKVDVYSSAEAGYFDTQMTDSLGHFEFKGFELADGAKMTIIARKGNGRVKRIMSNISIDKSILPEKVHHKPVFKRYFVNRKAYEQETNLTDDAVLSADALMHLAQTSDIFKSYLLKEVDVHGERQIRVKGPYSNLAEKSLDGMVLEQQGIQDLAGALRRLPGVSVIDNAIVWRNKYVPLFIDAVPEYGIMADEYDEYGFSYPTALNMPISSIARIDFMNENNAQMMAGNGLRGLPAIAVTLRVGASRSDLEDSQYVLHQPLGYQPILLFTPNSSTKMFIAELGMFIEDAETRWRQTLRNLPSGSVHTLIIEGIDSTGTPFSRVVKINND